MFVYEGVHERSSKFSLIRLICFAIYHDVSGWIWKFGVCVGKDLTEMKNGQLNVESEDWRMSYMHENDIHKWTRRLIDAHMLWVLWELDGGMQRQILDM